MADLSIDDALRFRRNFIASKTSLGLSNDELHLDKMNDSNENRNVIPPRVPSPPGAEKLSVNVRYGPRKESIFDLRPHDMRDTPDKFGRPSPRSFGIKDHEMIGRPFTADELSKAKMNLKKVKNPDPLSRNHNSYGSIRSSEPDGVEVRHCENARPNIPPAPPLPIYKPYRKEDENTDNARNELAFNYVERHPMTEDLLKSIGMSRTKLNDLSHDDMKRLKRRFARKKESLSTRSDKKWFKWIEEWLNDIDEVSIDSAILDDHVKKQMYSNELVTSKVNNAKKIDNDQIQLKRSTDSNRQSNARSHRTRSVCFSHPEGNDELSEVSADDIVDVKHSRVNYGSYTYICDQLEIREPFNNPELNVLHSMCCEYVTIAELTYAKRLFTIKSMTHNERVYNFLASSRKSGWLEKGDISRGINNCKTLDFIFSITLRRKSKIISGYTLNLDGFRKGRVLNTERFSRIMINAFDRRKYLFRCAVGELESYSKIK